MPGYPGENSIRYKEKVQRICKEDPDSCVVQKFIVLSQYGKQANKSSISIDSYPQKRVRIIILYNGRKAEDDYKECINEFHILLFWISSF